MKTIKTIKKNKPRKKNKPFLLERLEAETGLFFFNRKKIPPILIEHFGRKLINYSKDEDVLTITGFLREYEMPWETLRTHLKKNKDLKFMYDVAMQNIAYNREMASYNKHVDAIWRKQYVFDSQLRWQYRDQKLVAEELTQDTPTNVVVNFKDFSYEDGKPPKEKKDE